MDEQQRVRRGNASSPWSGFFEQTRQRPVRPLLLRALNFVPHHGSALDLGAGALRESRYLLDLGFRVVGVDNDPAFPNEAERVVASGLTPVFESFVRYSYPVDAFDLVVAFDALPFCTADELILVLAGIKRSLHSGGIFAGQLFGSRDSWNRGGRNMNFESAAEARTLWADMEILFFQEVERDAPSATGPVKHWHLFHLIARKK